MSPKPLPSVIPHELPETMLANVGQICIIVKDLQAAMEQYHSIFGSGPFFIYSVDTRSLPVTYRGKQAEYGLTVAMGRLGPLMLELMQLHWGESIFHEFVERHGEGVQHFGIFPDDYEEAYQELLRLGFKHVLGGPIPGKNRVGRFDFFETADRLGAVFEILDFPEEPYEAEDTYPKQS